MEPSKSNKKKWIVFALIIIGLVALIAVVPVIMVRHTKPPQQKPPSAEFMIKVKGIIKQQTVDNIVYLKGNNGLYYILLGDQLPNLLKNLDKPVTVFGNIVVPNSVVEGTDNVKINGNVIRMRINVVNFNLALK
ncbi:MAG: hypothetical protein LBT18_01705 [Endomicrobium sp.]|jgi:hypothetical protein|nr:hypothetical protein [Endomicrobium sp.]